MTNYLYNLLVINATTDQLVPWLSRLRRLATVILMRCRFPGVGSNPKNGYMFLIVIIFLFFSTFCFVVHRCFVLSFACSFVSI